MEESICIIDFAGNSREPGMWCDYWPEHKVVTFGGYWTAVPNMPSDTLPTEEECEAWAAKHATITMEWYEGYVADMIKRESGGE